MLVLSILTYFFWISQCLLINCTGDEACVSNHRNCTNNEDCTIICKGYSSCYSATFTCPNSTQFNISNECNILCNGRDSCRGINIMGGSYSKLYMDASGYDVLWDSYIEASKSSQLTLIGDGSYAFGSGRIICPSYNGTNDICNVIYNGNEAGFTNTSISSATSFIGVNIVCSTYSALNCWGSVNPRMYCTHPSNPWIDPWCSMITSDGINWNCQDVNESCYVDTVAPSIAPTNNPRREDVLFGMSLEVIFVASIVLIVIIIMILCMLYRCIQTRRDREEILNDGGANYGARLNSMEMEQAELSDSLYSAVVGK